MEIMFLLIAVCSFCMFFLVLDFFRFLIYMFVFYPIYKADGGKMKLKKYIKCMMADF